MRQESIYRSCLEAGHQGGGAVVGRRESRGLRYVLAANESVQLPCWRGPCRAAVDVGG